MTFLFNYIFNILYCYIVAGLRSSSEMPKSEAVIFYMKNYLHCLYFEFEVEDFKECKKLITEHPSFYSLLANCSEKYTRRLLTGGYVT